MMLAVGAAAGAAAAASGASSTAAGGCCSRKRRPRASGAARALGSTLALLAVALIPSGVESWIPPAASRPLLPPVAAPPTTTAGVCSSPAAAPVSEPFAFARRLLVRAAATKAGGGLRGDVKRKGDRGGSTSGGGGGGSSSGSRPRTRRPRNETASSSSSSSGGFFSGFDVEELGAQAAGAGAASPAEGETEAERAARLQEEDEWLLQFSREDTDAHTEVYSEPGERARKAQETRDRYDFTCLTVEEVARSYQVPISWVGDALCNFGVPPPIQWTARVGDLIDGERAYELLEAMHGWDHAVMYDMYTWDSLRELAASHELDLGDVLQICDEEGFALPFGLRSHLRVGQYARLMRRLGRAKELPDDVREKFPDPDYPSV